MNFREKLTSAMYAKQSLLCVGLDPRPEVTAPEDILAFNNHIVEETSDFVCAYKLQSAFYEVAGDLGWQAMQDTVRMIRDKSPHAIVIIDGKRGDVQHAAAAYAETIFEYFGADATTVNPYMGISSAHPFLWYGPQGKGTFFLCRTSNPGGGSIQNLRVQGDNGYRPLFMEIAEQVAEWGAFHSGVAGLVVGATYPSDVDMVRQLCPDIPILLPGVGAQGGDLTESVQYGLDAANHGLIVSASRSMYVDEPGEAARALRDYVNLVRYGS